MARSRVNVRGEGKTVTIESPGRGWSVVLRGNSKSGLGGPSVQHEGSTVGTGRQLCKPVSRFVTAAGSSVTRNDEQGPGSRGAAPRGGDEVALV